jgi:carbonic anhydrase
MVVGHYGCSGVKAAMENSRIGIADNWLRHVQDVRNQHHGWFYGLPEEGATRHNALCELNVLAQCLNVCHTTVVQDAWARGQEVVVHGWVYGLHNGLIKDLRMSVARPDELMSAYNQALDELRQRYVSQR